MNQIKVLYLTFFLLIIFTKTYCQNFKETNDVFNLLNNNTSSAFMVMGVSSTEIARPTNLKTFTTALQSATNGFSEIPSNFSFEVKPWAKEIGNDDDTKKFKELMSFSFGFSKDQAVVLKNQAKIGFGFNIDLFSTKDAIQNSENKFNQIETNEMSKLVEPLTASFGENIDKLDIDKLGFFMTIAGGITLNLDSNSVNKVSTGRSGIWTTFGYESVNSSGFTFLGVAKLFNEPNYLFYDAQMLPMFTQSNQLDFGLRALYKHNMFFVSIEYVYKLRDEVIVGLGNTDKYTLNFTYDLGNNNKLGLNLGKNFDNTVTKEGNLISMFNFVKSL